MAISCVEEYFTEIVRIISQAEKIQRMQEKKQVRLAHALSMRGVCARKEAEEKIRNAEVSVNGELTIDPAFKVDLQADRVTVNGKALPEKIKHKYIALHKPPGFLSAFKKGRERGQLLGELIKLDTRLFTAGRLDLNSRGLLLLTSNGDWANRVMHPRFEKEKEYLVRFKGARGKKAVKRFAAAKYSDRGKVFRAQSVTEAGDYVRVILKEGRNRQIRNLAEEAQLEVRDLLRIRVGDVQLGKLREGDWRNLKDWEIRSFDEKRK